MKKLRQLTFLQSFGYLALLLGLLIEIYALFNGLGSRLSGDDMFGGAVVLALAIAFIHSQKLPVNLILITLSTLGFGYFTFIHTQAWLWTIILAVLVAAFMIYFFGLRDDVRRNQSEWFHF
ncbi:hypothetical protein [Levilactobacillus tujiorum]|uniref:Integral membrane protein n=1 Tax=Levilactobacillus tujiorum TaxID=2912243 RepID=A0ABX1L7U2_9LACO|nr:hypothetical protein [Levilactobacillus tujiorum]MCH5465408.1 hypothetical protein [Levilactobacillus tujiorum]NLR12345.1 hypothetical protein [Lactobacillus sp. HBUAS51387]NLR30411.1 hypothetical protein [Levilactobacillus tujiorum]NLR32991.1 hypothetical protein [Levilactobacillus tujiorum]